MQGLEFQNKTRLETFNTPGDGGKLYLQTRVVHYSEYVPTFRHEDVLCYETQPQYESIHVKNIKISSQGYNWIIHTKIPSEHDAQVFVSKLGKILTVYSILGLKFCELANNRYEVTTNTPLVNRELFGLIFLIASVGCIFWCGIEKA